MEKRLYKSKTDRKLCGVCGGIAEYFNIDVTLIRILWTCLTLVAGTGLLIYIVCALVMPEDNRDAILIPKNKKETKKLYRSNTDSKIAGVCGGIAEYFNIDSTIIRVIWIAATLFVGYGIISYILCALIIPKNSGK